MKPHWFQHVEFEGLGLIEAWLRARGHDVSVTRWWATEAAGADAAACEWLIVMGGPMNSYKHLDYPWLVAEKVAIASAVSRGARVLGVCLGAQLIADVLGGKVVQNPEREIGWWAVRRWRESRMRARINWRAVVAGSSRSRQSKRASRATRRMPANIWPSCWRQWSGRSCQKI